MSGGIGDRSDVPKSVVARALSVLAVFNASAPRMSLGQVAQACGLPTATTFRILRELVSGGALERSDDGRYQPGFVLWQMGLLAPVHRNLRERALPHLLRFLQEVEETVQLAVLDGTEAIYVEKLSLDEHVPRESRIGARIPLHATGVGKALLAACADTVTEEVIGSGLSPFAPQTIVVPDALRDEVEKTRQRGYALSDQEFSTGATSLAAALPIASRTAAAVGIVSYRRDLRLERHVPALLRCVAAICDSLGDDSPEDVG